MNVRQFCLSVARREAERGFHAMINDPYTRLYLYGTEGDIRVAAEMPFPVWYLANMEALPRSCTIDSLTVWILERIQSVPFLPKDLVS